MIIHGAAILATILIGWGVDTKSWLPAPDLAGQPQGIAPTGLLGRTEFGFGMTRPFRLKLWGLPYKKPRRC